MFGLLALLVCFWLWGKIAARFKVDVKGKAVLITGCDTGFGALMARRCDAQGMRVFANCLTKEAAATLREDCSSNLTTLVFDVTDEKAVEDAHRQVSESCDEQGLWAVVNNAGIYRGSIMDWSTMKDYRATMEVNFFAMVNICRTFAPLVKKGGHGRFVNMVSLSGRCGAEGMGPYTASKHAMEGFSDSLRAEMKPWGVKVSIIEPAFLKTPMVAGLKGNIQSIWDRLPADMQRLYGQSYLDAQLGKTAVINNSQSGDPIIAVDAMTSALTAQYPQSRYLVGPGSYVMAVLAMLPGSIMDFFGIRLGKLVGIRPVKPAGAPYEY